MKLPVKNEILLLALILSCVSCAAGAPARGGDRRAPDSETIPAAIQTAGPDRGATPQLPNAKPSRVSEAVITASVVPAARTYEEDTFHLFALIESWPGSNADETGRLLTEEFLEVAEASFPNVPKPRWNELSREFQPKVVAAFRSRAAAVCRDHFSHEEVRQLIQFYETPVGRKYARAFTELVDKMRAYDPQRKVVMEELVSRIRKQGSEPHTSKGE